jgi:hypothetical protein
MISSISSTKDTADDESHQNTHKKAQREIDVESKPFRADVSRQVVHIISKQRVA